MNFKLAIATLALCFSAQAAGPNPSGARSALELLGKWEGHMEFGKMKFTLLLRMATNSAGRLEVGIELPEQGQRGMKAGALLFNAPDVRIEIDQFNTVYSG